METDGTETRPLGCSLAAAVSDGLGTMSAGSGVFCQQHEMFCDWDDITVYDLDNIHTITHSATESSLNPLKPIVAVWVQL